MWLESASVLIAVNDDTRPTLRAHTVVNCAGLHAPEVAALVDALRGMAATLFPIVRLEEHAPDEWRGRIDARRAAYRWSVPADAWRRPAPATARRRP